MVRERGVWSRKFGNSRKIFDQRKMFFVSSEICDLMIGERERYIIRMKVELSYRILDRENLIIVIFEVIKKFLDFII